MCYPDSKARRTVTLARRAVGSQNTSAVKFQVFNPEGGRFMKKTQNEPKISGAGWSFEYSITPYLAAVAGCGCGGGWDFDPMGLRLKNDVFERLGS